MSEARDRFAEAWEGWIRPLLILGACALAYLAYNRDWVSETLAGGAVVLSLLTAALLTAWPAQRLVREPYQRALYYLLLPVWAVSTLYPSMRAAIPPSPLAVGTLTTRQRVLQLSTGKVGPYEIVVAGAFTSPGGTDLEARYSLKVSSGGGETRVDGVLRHVVVKTRASRRGGRSTSTSDHTAAVHRLDDVTGSAVTISTEEVDEQLGGVLSIAIRDAAPAPFVFGTLWAAALLCALVLDARLTDGKKGKSALLASVAGSVVFAYYFPTEATPHAVVRPAVAALLLGLFAGAPAGWITSKIARAAFGPRPRA